MSSNYETLVKSKKIKDHFIEYEIKGKFITATEFFIMFCGFVLSRGAFTNYLMPFAYPFAVYILYRDQKKWWTALPMILGVISTGQLQFLYHHILAFSIMFITYIKINDKLKKKWHVAIYACFCTILSGFISNLFTGQYLFDYALSVLEGMLGFTLFYIYETAMNLFIHRSRKFYSNQEIICLGIFISILILGLSDLYISRFSISAILSIFLILLFSYKIGIGVSAPLGITLGLILNLSSQTSPLMIAVYGLCGMISGLFKEAGKIFVIGGFIISNSMIAFYINGSTEVFIHIEEIIIASVLLYIIPNKLWDKISFFNFDKVQVDYQQFCKERINENLRSRLNQYSLLLKELGVTFCDDGQGEKDEKLYISAIENIMGQVCGNCYLMSRCWKTDGQNTCNMIKESLEFVENEDYSNLTLVKNKCIYDEKLISLLKEESEHIAYNKRTNNRIHTNNLLVANQLQYAGDLINSLKNDLHDEWLIKSEEEKDILIELDKNEISVDKIFVIREKNKRYKITLTCNQTYKDQVLLQTIPTIISDILQRKMGLYNKVSSSDGAWCKAIYTESAPYRLTTGLARFAQKSEEKSGDIFSDLILGDGNRLLALCDGMGIGNNAYKESEPTINLLEKFMDASIDKAIMVKTINSILMLRNERETFSTLDFVVFDQYCAMAEFNKIGAAITLIIQKNEVKLIRGQSLPVGILEEIKIETVKMQLNEGDCVIMMTDGIFECYENPDQVEKWIINTVNNITTKNPQKIADEIFGKFIEICPQPSDDITILVGKVWSK